MTQFLPQGPRKLNIYCVKHRQKLSQRRHNREKIETKDEESKSTVDNSLWHWSVCQHSDAFCSFYASLFSAAYFSVESLSFLSCPPAFNLLFRPCFLNESIKLIRIKDTIEAWKGYIWNYEKFTDLNSQVVSIKSFRLKEDQLPFISCGVIQFAIVFSSL